MENNNQELQQFCAKFNLQKGLINNLSKSQSSRKNFMDVVGFAKLQNAQKKIGNMLYTIATKPPVIIEKHRQMLAKCIGTGEIYNPNQLDYVIDYLIAGEKKGGIDLDKFNKDCGIGIKHTQDEIKNFALDEIKDANQESVKIEFFLRFKGKIPYVEGKILKDVFDKIWKDKGLPQNNKPKEKKQQKQKTGGKDKDAPNKDNKKQQQNKQKQDESAFHIKDISDCIGRQMNSCVNSKNSIAWRQQKFGSGVLTRFPPEPNGYLHIGHCKAMRFNFMQAKTTGGKCYLRYDDTNPLKQNKQFIINIEQNIRFMGYEPWKITHASDNFQHLHKFAVQLIKQGDAFVCSQTKQQMKKNRAQGLPSKDRNRPIEQNLKLFEEMKLGMYEQGQYSLRAKIDFKHPNTTLRDPVIYRIRYTSHPHVGDKWCIYPLYDFTHPLCDSLQGISHSLCSLQFQIRRQLYYWVLEKLDLYRPNVWEYSRLNITGTVLSKRKLHQLIFTNRVNGWDDPRVLTINGMRRRGYPAQAINNFCDVVGVTRRGNQNYINFSVLQNQVRKYLDVHAPRTMGIVDPVQMIIQDAQQGEIDVPFFPKNQQKGKRKIKFTKRVFVDRDNVKLEDSADFFGVAPNKIVGLKYSSTVFVRQVKKDENGEITQIIAQIDKKKAKPKAFLHWISDVDSIDCQTRVYGTLFTVEKPGDYQNYLDYLNPNSLKVYKNSKCHRDFLKTAKIDDKVQFERKGFFCIDKESKFEQGKIVWNMTVGLADRMKK